MSRAFDGAYAWCHFITGDAYVNLKKKRGKIIASPLERTTSVCIVNYPAPKKNVQTTLSTQTSADGGKPFFDESEQPTVFQTMLETKIVEQDTYTFVGRLRILQEGKKQVYDNAIRKYFTINSMVTVFFLLRSFPSAKVPEFWTGLVGNLQALDETS